MSTAPLAGEDQVPAALRRLAIEPLRPTLHPSPPAPVARWQQGQREAWLSQLPAADWEEAAATLGLSDEARRYVIEGTGDPATAAAGIERPRGERIGVWRSRPWLDLLLGLGPVAVARLFGLGGGNWRATPEALRGFVAANEFEVARIARAFPPSLVDDLLAVLTPIADVRVAALAARRVLQVGADSKIGAAALGWLLANAEHAAFALSAAALTEEGGKARAARMGLLVLAERGHRDAVDSAARAFGVEPDALLVLPVISELPHFWNPQRIAAPVLSNGKQLPIEATELFVKLLVAKTPSANAQLNELDAAFSRESLERFALDVFNAALWRPKSRTTELWPQVLGRYGGDVAVELLAGKMKRDWTDGEELFEVSCGVLQQIATPLAIVELAHQADKRRAQDWFTTAQDAAQSALEAIASARAITPRELIGGAVATLGRGAAQPHSLSFGPRAFRVELDSRLSPVLFDEDGERITKLPRPRKSDDTEAVSQAKEQRKQLLAKLAQLAPVLLTQLEEDLVHDRRWPRVSFEHWLEHDELFQHVAKHLVWALWSDAGVLLSPAFVYEGGLQPTIDGTADPDRVGLLHPIDVSAETLVSLREAMIARDLQPPFAQLDREMFRPSAEEQQAESISKFAGARLRLRRHLLRGWRQGPVDEDTAYIYWNERPFECGVTAEFLHSGIDCGDCPPSSVKIEGLRFRGATGLMKLIDVPARCLSEAVRDAAELASGT